MRTINISELKGFKIGQSTDIEAGTGCTVILSEGGAVAGVDVRGGAPGTRETDLLKSENLVEKIHSVFLSGGSAYGLNVAGGIMKFLEEKQVGFDVGVAKVPIVPGAILFDLTVGRADKRPGAHMGYQAAEQAWGGEPFQSGNAGAGTGASVGKLLGNTHAMKGGIGAFAVEIGELQVGAIVAVNAFGDVIDSKTGEKLAGLQSEGQWLDTEHQMLNQLEAKTNRFSGNTTIGAVLTNAKWEKSQANKIASIAHDGLARCIRPSHTFVDGDTIFTLSTDEVAVDLNVMASLSAYVVEHAVKDAVVSASSAYGLLAYNEIK
ncbi:peptidase S58 family protein [Halobacillus fulvus]|nr:peptidase S58 family protein [Halobacillus fulvus]